MANIFLHPFTLFFKIGKNLIVNGAEIFLKITEAILADKSGDYFTFGKLVGEALNDIIIKSPAIKNIKDERAYDFLAGFIQSIELKTEVDYQ